MGCVGLMKPRFVPSREGGENTTSELDSGGCGTTRSGGGGEEGGAGGGEEGGDKETEGGGEKKFI